jgi:hypothetical protein
MVGTHVEPADIIGENKEDLGFFFSAVNISLFKWIFVCDHVVSSISRSVVALPINHRAKEGVTDS